MGSYVCTFPFSLPWLASVFFLSSQMSVFPLFIRERTSGTEQATFTLEVNHSSRLAFLHVTLNEKQGDLKRSNHITTLAII